MASPVRRRQSAGLWSSSYFPASASHSHCPCAAQKDRKNYLIQSTLIGNTDIWLKVRAGGDKGRNDRADKIMVVFVALLGLRQLKKIEREVMESSHNLETIKTTIYHSNPTSIFILQYFLSAFVHMSLSQTSKSWIFFVLDITWYSRHFPFCWIVIIIMEMQHDIPEGISHDWLNHCFLIGYFGFLFSPQMFCCSSKERCVLHICGGWVCSFSHALSYFLRIDCESEIVASKGINSFRTWYILPNCFSNLLHLSHLPPAISERISFTPFFFFFCQSRHLDF